MVLNRTQEGKILLGTPCKNIDTARDCGIFSFYVLNIYEKGILKESIHPNIQEGWWLL